ncbi:hypothetical protein HFD88_002270 [Aspergillus terreus]|nr:hypothetical protein HFD88_002270 [Aspergillus terreus]
MDSKYDVPAHLPPLKDLTIDNITKNVQAINSQCKDPRTRFLFERLVAHLHDFARETRLSTSEWETALSYLVDVGKISTDVRHEFILLSDVLGLSLLVDSIDHPKPSGSTEGTVLGPFHTKDANSIELGGLISHDPDGEALFAVCSIKDTQGRPIPAVSVDVWETDSKGFYDVQYAGRETPDGRAILTSDEDGMIYFKGIVPVPALYLRGDPFESSDAVFGVKESLVIDLKRVGDVPGLAEKHGIPSDTWLLQHDFVLITERESRAIKTEEARKQAARQGGTLHVVDGHLIPSGDTQTLALAGLGVLFANPGPYGAAILNPKYQAPYCLDRDVHKGKENEVLIITTAITA